MVDERTDAGIEDKECEVVAGWFVGGKRRIKRSVGRRRGEEGTWAGSTGGYREPVADMMAYGAGTRWEIDRYPPCTAHTKMYASVHAGTFF